MNLPKGYKILLAVLSGMSLSFSWLIHGLSPFLLISFIPLLIIEDSLTGRKSSGTIIFGYSYLAFFIWNLLTTWWIIKATVFGGIMAMVFNSMFMSLVFMFFHKTKKKTNKSIGYLSLIVYWITFEYLHHDWDLSWTWLTIGNCFAFTPQLVQWYEYTGVFGGTLWVLIINILLFLTIKFYSDNEKIKNKRLIIICSLLIILPAAFSVYRYISYSEKKSPVEIEVVQPNIDPYNEKFNGMSPADQIAKLLDLAGKKINSKTEYVIGPETALPDGYWENNLIQYRDVLSIKNFVKEHPQVKFVLGLSSFKMYPSTEEITPTARKFENGTGYYDAFNSAMQIDTTNYIPIYHKSKLVPGVELMPFPAIFKYLDKFAINMGGIAGSLGMQKERSVFTSPNSDYKIAPIICYESIYGEYVSKYVKNGANFLFIMTNDGWWGDTEGYKQHLNYARLRAIENRRSIARSANTGISCFINQRGDLSETTKWWTPDVIKGTLNSNDEITFYTKYGDYIGFLSMYLSLFIILFTLYTNFRRNK
ncbi:MAG: apolipoprotein N-acyltransferase [Bacteroidota bacterium]|nr:apolipoprotein N-acyltransferase [Bacteroidota bacterium]